MTMKLRLEAGGGASGSPAGAGRRYVWAFRSLSLCLPRLLSSEIVFQVGLSDAEGTGQRELGGVVLVERADVLVVGLFGLGLGLRDGQVVRDAGVEALLRFAQFFVGEVQVRLRRIDELGRGLDVENGVADVGVDLLNLVGEFIARLLVVARRRRPLRPWSWPSAGWALRACR